jgi:hypothetical protein
VLAGAVAVGAWQILVMFAWGDAAASFGALGTRAVLALAVFSLAVTAAGARGHPHAAPTVGAAVAFGWALSTNLISQDASIGLSTAWIEHATVVTGAGVAALWLATRS